ncbi:cobamide remodeling phosphodiesterase CbiR [Desulfobacula toluolica]|uniref:Xylose isomerase domain protein, TIM barrel n=1 Tax=Desulfobacula toluolica (strain DSM 7467 / Tol2) TaxID=651182 RepID=K0NKQ8_DESTT|nr:cobamide remodeling phosphodiesterase CbiR [Desulfobacula toluolica]CCK82146.1 xylose isomerase domain protein, TIM barrel [Desulfobacula toluolica Tol2]
MAVLPDKPFKLGTTSFIFPDHIIPNVKKLGAFFDEIELLVFESMPEEVLPSKDDVKKLLELSQKLNLTYNIHLPIDVSLTCDDLKKRQTSADMLLKVIDLFTPLAPSTHTLHLDMPKGIKTDKGNLRQLKDWEEKARQGLGALVSGLSNPGIISVETLDYPFSLVETLVEEFKTSVCIDVGHQIKYGHNLLKTFEKHQYRTSIMHLHGVDFSVPSGKDHTALDKLPEKHFRQVQFILENFEGVVSIEVFNLENLNRSLAFLSKIFKNIAPCV